MFRWSRPRLTASVRSGSSYGYQIPNGPDIEEMYIQKEQCALFYKTLDTLDEAMREVMLLRLSGEFSFREIYDRGRNGTPFEKMRKMPAAL